MFEALYIFKSAICCKNIDITNFTFYVPALKISFLLSVGIITTATKDTYT